MGKINSGSDRNLNVNFHYESNVDKLAKDAAVIENLAAQVEKLEVTIKQQAGTIEDYAFELDRAHVKIEELTSGAEWQRMSEKAEKATSLARQSYNELIAFIEANRLDEVFDSDWDMQHIAEQVRSGEKTVGQAISEIKLEFRSLIESEKEGFDTSILQNFMSTLNALSEAVSELDGKIEYLRENGIKTIGNTGSEGAGNLAGLFESISGASDDMTKSVGAAFQPVTDLVGAVAQYQNIDTEKIQAISSTFRNLAATTSNSLGDKTTNNIIKLLTDLQAVTAGKPINIAMNVSGIEELKVKKTSLSNLATYLPEIAKVNVNKLKELSNVDFTNFSNLKISKGAVEEISKIANAMQILKEVKATSVTADGKGISITESTKKAQQSYEAWLKDYEAREKQGMKEVADYEKQLASENVATAQETTQQKKAVSKEYEAWLKDYEAREKQGMKEAADYEKQLKKELVENERQTAKEKAELEKKVASEAKAAADAVTKAEKDKAKEMSETQKYQKRAASLLAEMTRAEQNWTKARDGASKGNYTWIQNATTGLKQYINDLSSGKMSVSEFAAKVDEMSVSFKMNASEIKAAHENTLSLGDRIGKLSSKFGAWLSITRIIMGVIRTIKQMVKAVVEIDSAMTQLQIVTKSTSDEMARFGETAAKTSKEIGSTITDFTSSVTTFARLGYNLDESSALAKYTAMLQNVGDIDVTDAQNSITSIIKAFGISADQIESVMDKLVVTGKLLPGHTVMCA